MIERAQWPYGMAIAMLLAALTVLYWPNSEEVVDEPTPRAARGLAVKTLDASVLEEIAASGARLPFRMQAASIEPAQEQPPVVTGVARIGGRGFAYIEGGERSGRLAIGQTTNGWTLAAVGANFAEFSRGGETHRVRLFAREARPASAAADPAAQALAVTIPTPVPAQGPSPAQP